MQQSPGSDRGWLEPAARAESIWRAPLLSVALVYTLGVALDRFGQIPLGFSLLLGGVALVAFGLCQGFPSRQIGLVYLALTGVAFGAAYHHYRQQLYPTDDLGRDAPREPVPVHLVGILEEEPRRLPGRDDPLRSQRRQPSASSILQVTSRLQEGERVAVSGRVRLMVTGERQPLLAELHPGDEIEVRGKLSRFAPRASPGEFDFAGYWHDRGVHALLTVAQGDVAVRRLRPGWIYTPSGWFAALRHQAHARLDQAVPQESLAGLARALLLGEGAPLSADDWGKYVRTGVVHVLAISGQHLLVVGLFLWSAARLVGLRQRHAAILVAGVLLGYALVTGGRPPALRAAVGVCALCLGLVLRRPAVPANLFALAWLVVGLVRPADLFESGCQLSFLAVAVLCWGTSGWFSPRPLDPLEELIERSRPFWQRACLTGARVVGQSYLVGLLVWVAVTPLAAYHVGIFAPAALLLGPPLTLLTSVALLAGFLVLALPGPLAALPAWVLTVSLRGCEWLVDGAERWPTHLWTGPLPAWWVVLFYLGLLAVLTHRTLRIHWRWTAPAGLAWVCVFFLVGAMPSGRVELRCTFLPVGHGAATLLEFPDGRTLLVDAGSLRGPDVVARTLSPFLWSRGISRLDDVVLSHADLDHFNGLIELADRFAIGRVLTSDSFADRPSEAVALTRQKLHHLRWEVLAAGDRLVADEVELAVLHPPRGYQGGNQNARSVVLEVRHHRQRLLLTGDLEGEGLARVLTLPGRRIDVLMAPHHGSARLDVAALVRWCRPGLVVSSQGAARGARPAGESYLAEGVLFWTTHEQGAVTVRSGSWGLEAEAYSDGRRWRCDP
ncbi:MAG: ComEC/Rec2 family competence protein [Gemmataceae bacterium]